MALAVVPEVSMLFDGVFVPGQSAPQCQPPQRDMSDRRASCPTQTFGQGQTYGGSGRAEYLAMIC